MRCRSVCFPTLAIYVTVNSEFQWGHGAGKKQTLALLTQEKTGNRPREGSDPGCSAFQITEDAKTEKAKEHLHTWLF